MPSSLVEDHQYVFTGGNGFGEFIKVDLHRLCGDFRHDKGEGIVRTWFGCGKNVSEGIALIDAPRRALTFGVPAVANAPFLPGPRFILEEQPDLFAWIGLCNGFQPVRKAPLKAVWAASSFLGW
jgi:hypothetical protein